MTEAELSEIHRVANGVRGNCRSYLNCGPVSKTIWDALRETLDLEPILVEQGCISYTPRSQAGAEHAFVMIPAEQLVDRTEPVIVDGTLDQFCEQNREEGVVSVSLGPRESFETVDIIKQSDDRWGRFRWDSTDTRGQHLM